MEENHPSCIGKPPPRRCSRTQATTRASGNRSNSVPHRALSCSAQRAFFCMSRPRAFNPKRRSRLLLPVEPITEIHPFRSAVPRFSVARALGKCPAWHLFEERMPRALAPGNCARSTHLTHLAHIHVRAEARPQVLPLPTSWSHLILAAGPHRRLCCPKRPVRRAECSIMGCKPEVDSQSPPPAPRCSITRAMRLNCDPEEIPILSAEAVSYVEAAHDASFCAALIRVANRRATALNSCQ